MHLGISFLWTSSNDTSVALMFSVSSPLIQTFPNGEKVTSCNFYYSLGTITWCLMLGPIFESQLTCRYCAICSLRAGVTSVFLIIHPQDQSGNRQSINIYWMPKGRKENMSELILQTFPGQTLCFRFFFYLFSIEFSALNKVTIKTFFFDALS